jgi:hypothetical protein
MYTALYVMVTVQSSPWGLTTKISNEISVMNLFPTYSASPVLCLLECGIRVASMSSVDSIVFLSSVLIFLWERKSFWSCGMVMVILRNRCASLRVNSIFFTMCKSNLCFLNGVHFIHPKLSLFFPTLPPFSSRSRRSQRKYQFYSWEVSSSFSFKFQFSDSSGRCLGDSNHHASFSCHSSVV